MNELNDGRGFAVKFADEDPVTEQARYFYKVRLMEFYVFYGGFRNGTTPDRMPEGSEGIDREREI